jgi:hypothetical protein
MENYRQEVSSLERYDRSEIALFFYGCLTRFLPILQVYLGSNSQSMTKIFLNDLKSEFTGANSHSITTTNPYSFPELLSIDTDDCTVKKGIFVEFCGLLNEINQFFFAEVDRPSLTAIGIAIQYEAIDEIIALKESSELSYNEKLVQIGSLKIIRDQNLYPQQKINAIEKISERMANLVAESFKFRMF